MLRDVMCPQHASESIFRVPHFDRTGLKALGSLQAARAQIELSNSLDQGCDSQTLVCGCASASKDSRIISSFYLIFKCTSSFMYLQLSAATYRTQHPCGDCNLQHKSSAGLKLDNVM